MQNWSFGGLFANRQVQRQRRIKYEYLYDPSAKLSNGPNVVSWYFVAVVTQKQVYLGPSRGLFHTTLYPNESIYFVL